MGASTTPVRTAEITDGTANTLMFGEYATAKGSLTRRTLWAYAYTSYNLSAVTIGQSRTLIADFDICSLSPPTTNGNNQCKRAWGSLHAGGTLNFAFCDGSVRSRRTSQPTTAAIPTETWRSDHSGTLGPPDSRPRRPDAPTVMESEPTIPST